MKPRPKLRKFVKWTGLVLCVVLLAVWIGNRWYSLSWSSSSGRWGIVLSQGCVGCVDIGETRLDARGFDFEAVPVPLLALGFYHETSQTKTGIKGWHAFAPLWFPLLISCACTVWLWRVDRRLSQIGKCKRCGYDLSGLAGNACPECGVKT